jgi:acyl-CoA-binding protein
MSLKRRFERAVKKVWRLNYRPDNNTLLRLYALYKQATDGDCEGKARGDIKERAKHKAWFKVNGISEVDAMEQYCRLVKSLMG